MKYRQKLLLALGLVFMPLGTLAAQQKYALVIGNSAYTLIAKLNNPVNDADDLTAVLQGLGFEVKKVLNVNLDQMEEGVLWLKDKLKRNKNSYGLFYYAGHGIQSQGRNYLIPIDADIKSEAFLQRRALGVQEVMNDLNQAENILNILVLDACRNNPFTWARGESRGLTIEPGQPADSILVYATSAGSTAADGTGRNGLFTMHFLNSLQVPGLEVHEVFRRTGAAVSGATGKQQIPEITSKFFGAAYLGNGAGPIISPAVPEGLAFEVMEGGTERNHYQVHRQRRLPRDSRPDPESAGYCHWEGGIL